MKEVEHTYKEMSIKDFEELSRRVDNLVMPKKTASIPDELKIPTNIYVKLSEEEMYEWLCMIIPLMKTSKHMVFSEKRLSEIEAYREKLINKYS